MALAIQRSFSAGELDPALHERTNLEKYQSALATARNVIVGKTGRVLTRMGSVNIVKTKTDSVSVKSHFMSHIGQWLEVGTTWIRVYDMDGTLDQEVTVSYTTTQISNLQFVDLNDDEVMLILGDDIDVLSFSGSSTTGAGSYFEPFHKKSSGYNPGHNSGSSSNAGTGYTVEYAFTVVVDGEESPEGQTGSSPVAFQLPTGTQVNVISIDIGTSISENDVEEVRVYRRPLSGGVYGYIGSTSSNSGDIFTFRDTALDADYTQQLPLDQALNYTFASFVEAKCATMYQQRLVVAFPNRILTSRIGLPHNFDTNIPITDESSLILTFGVSGVDIPRFMIEHEGLNLFTNRGVYTHTGILSTSNLAMIKRGDWIIDPDVPPLAVPGGILFVDSATNTVRQLVYNGETGSYEAPEISIFSDHLFQQKKVKSWAFQTGEFPLVWITFTDGTLASLTYEYNHQMRAWCRHDRLTDTVEYVGAINNFNGSSKFYLQTLNGTKRYYEYLTKRYPSVDDVLNDAESDKNESIAKLDSMVSWSHLINDDLADDDLTLTPVVADDWEGSLTLACTDDAIFPDPGLGTVGTKFKYFDSNRSQWILTVTARASDNSVTVVPDSEFPSTAATNPRLYEAKNNFSGLTHLEGENVTIIADGEVIACPQNDIAGYDTVTVSSGAINLPDSGVGAIVHIGRAYWSDVETLDIDSVEQRPILIESNTINKLYIKVYKSRPFYISGRFPSTDALLGVDATNMTAIEMSDISRLDVDYENEEDIILNRYDQPVTKRLEVILPGDWSSNGRVAIRQPDPIHFEILSIMPDVESLLRNNRGGE